MLIDLTQVVDFRFSIFNNVYFEMLDRKGNIVNIKATPYAGSDYFHYKHEHVLMI